MDLDKVACVVKSIRTLMVGHQLTVPFDEPLSLKDIINLKILMQQDNMKLIFRRKTLIPPVYTITRAE